MREDTMDCTSYLAPDLDTLLIQAFGNDCILDNIAEEILNEIDEFSFCASEEQSLSPSSTDSSDTTLAQYNNNNNNGKLCYVCGNAAGKHNYYGGQVCNSCRAFFRRSVQNDTHGNFLCRENGNCEINSRSWKSCQCCRFRKCLESGMNTYWVLNETDRKVRNERRENRQKSKKLTASGGGGLGDRVVRRSPMDLFTTEDDMHVRGLFFEIVNFGHSEELKFYSRYPDRLDEVLSAIYHGSPITMETQLVLDDFISNSIRHYIQGMTLMSDLSETDKRRLLDANQPNIHSFIVALCTDELYLEMFSGLLQTRAEEDPQHCVADRFRKMSLNGKLRVRGLRHEQLYDWAGDRETEERHRELTKSAREWVSSDDERKVDVVQLMLMNLVMLFSPDFIQLEDSRRAEEVQTKYAMLLSKYIKSKYSHPGSKFCKAMVVGSISRELREIRNKLLRQR